MMNYLQLKLSIIKKNYNLIGSLLGSLQLSERS